MKSKNLFAERVILELQNDYPNIDIKLDERMIYLCLDGAVNEMAKKNYFENWRLSGGAVDEQFITLFEDIAVTDYANDLPSTMTLPANWVALPRNGGIASIYPKKWQTRYQPTVTILTFEEYRRLLSNPASNMQGRLTAYVKGGRTLEFTECGVAKKYGAMNVRLVIRDSSAIADDAPYGIPADQENAVVALCIEYYRNRRFQPTDSVRDNKDQA